MLQKKATPQSSSQMPTQTTTSQAQPETVIGPGIHIKGDLQGKSNIQIKGSLEGNIRLEGHVDIGPGGKLIGDISATTVVVEGAVTGNIEAREKVEQHLALNPEESEIPAIKSKLERGLASVASSDGGG